jgi:integrase/recombinase XerD
MPPLRQQMIAALQLSGTSERTQQSYVREGRLLAQFYGTSPHLISESELQHYMLHRQNVDHLAPPSMRIGYSGIRFFSLHVLERAWKLLDLIRAQAAYRLPAIRRVQEVRRLLSMATPLHNRVYFPTVSRLGLRLHEGRLLHVSDLDGQRLMGHVHRGKGAKARDVPLPPDTFALVRHSWTTHRHPPGLFPATGRDQKPMTTATAPMHRRSVQGAFRKAQQRAGLMNRAVGIPPLRHCYATPRLEAGVHLRAMQRYMGHARLATPMLSRHLTPKGQEEALQRIHTVMRGLPS